MSKKTNKLKADLSMDKCPYCGSGKVLSKGPRKTNHGTKRMYKCHNCSKHFQNTILEGQSKRVVILSDLHSGHVTGLTPPEYNSASVPFYDFRKESWQWFEGMIKSLYPIDVLILNGDLIDGGQEKNGGSELVTGDRFTQCKMAEEAIKLCKAKHIYITYGTPYHVGKDESFEDLIADRVGAKIFNHLRLDINGCIIDARHKIGSSNIPHGRFTALARAAMWNDLMKEDTEKSNVIIRSHVHYHTYLGHSNNRICFTTPALQGISDFGEKMCEGNVDYGFVKMDINSNSMIENFRMYKAELETNKRQIEILK